MQAEWSLPMLQAPRVRAVPATVRAIKHVANNLRESDMHELVATTGHRDFEAALLMSARISRSLVVFEDTHGEPMAVLGVGTVSLLYNTGSPWMLATPRAQRFPSALISLGRSYTAYMLTGYDRLENHVDTRNATSIAWLRHLGYHIDAAQPYGALGLSFNRFWMER